MPLSAGLVVYRSVDGRLQVLLARLGGPLWAKREHWTIPKGLLEGEEDAETAARREFTEETGWAAPDGPSIALGEIRQRGGKRVAAWGVAGDFDPSTLEPGTFEMEWPPRSGRTAAFPEISEVRWFDLAEARAKINQAQVPLLDRLEGELTAGR